jgi:dolichol-phosphate mannosyltransferase
MVSVVLSFRNEAENIPALVGRLSTVLAAEGVDYELLFINDASTDDSLQILLGERERNRRLKIINLSRRFGVAEGVLAGMAVASGEAVIYMDADLQDPPELIPELLARWRGGADVVHTVRTRRHGEHPLKMWATRLAYRVIQYGSAIELPVDAGDFKLLSRKVVDELLRLPESDPYLRGLVVWLGHTQVFVPYERRERHAGRTHFPFFSRNPWKTFALGLTSFSFLPIYVCAGAAALGILTGTALLLVAAGASTSGLPGAASTAVAGVVALLWGATIGAVSSVGLYVIRIYKDVRRRPPYIVDSMIGVTTTAPRSLATQAEQSER